jgi:hypothetical protein
MKWSVTNLWIQIVTGILGGHAAAVAAKEHSFGVLGHTVAGIRWSSEWLLPPNARSDRGHRRQQLE